MTGMKWRDVVEQMQDDLLEAEEMISDEPQAKDEPTVGKYGKQSKNYL